MGKKLAPIHPGEVLLEDFLKPMGVSQYRIATAISVLRLRINEIVHGKGAITADTALRLSRCFGTSEAFWTNLQAHYDLELRKDFLGDRLAWESVPSAKKVSPELSERKDRWTGMHCRTYTAFW